MTPADDVEKIANHGTGWGRDDPDGPREGWQGPFSIRVENPLGLKPLFQLLESQLEGSGPHWFDGFPHQLQLAPLRIYAYSTTNEHVQPILRMEAQQQCLAAEEHDEQLCVCILQGEVKMPRWRRTEVGYLALYPHIGVFLLNLLTNLIHKLAHRPNTAHELRC